MIQFDKYSSIQSWNQQVGMFLFQETARISRLGVFLLTSLLTDGSLKFRIRELSRFFDGNQGEIFWFDNIDYDSFEIPWLN